MKVWINGNYLNIDEVKVSPLSYGFSRACAVFEVIEIIKNENGVLILGLDQHIERLFNSISFMNIDIPYSFHDIQLAIIETVKINKIKNGIIKLFIYNDSIELGIIPKNKNIILAIFTLDFKNTITDNLNKPAKVIISSFKKISNNAIPSFIKVTGNYVNSYLAQNEAISKGYTDALLLSSDGFITEGAISNIFFTKDKDVFTPPPDNIIPGITRKMIIDICKVEGINCFEQNILSQHLNNFNEAFFSGSINKIQPIETINNINYKVNGEMTLFIKSKYNDLINDSHPLSKNYITYI